MVERTSLAHWSRAVAKWESHALDWLQTLVSVNSFTQNFEGVREVGKISAQMFQLLDFEVELFASDSPEAPPHLALHRRGRLPQKVVLVSHLDTVYPPEEERENHFFWHEVGERIYGPGVADIKGGTVVAYLALLALREVCPRAWEDLSWTILFNASEEEGSLTFPDVARQNAQGGVACLVYELSRDREDGVSEIVEARKGAGRFRIEVRGRQAHSGSAHEWGANAIWQLARIVEKLQSLTDYQRGITVNVGILRGGVAVNRVPDHCWAEVDLRSFTKEDYEEVRRQILALAGKGDVVSVADGYACRVEVRELAGYAPWPPNRESRELAKTVCECGRQLGQEIVPVRKHGSSDGCFLWDVLPTVDGLGPIGGNIHCSRRIPEEGIDQEYVLRRSIGERALLSLAVFYQLWQRLERQ